MSSIGMEIAGVVGLASTKPQSYCFHPITGDLLYTAGSMIVVYAIQTRTQKFILQNPKGYPYISLAITSDGRDLIAAEAMGQGSKNDIHQWQYSIESDQYIKKNTLRTSFQLIDLVVISPNKELVLAFGQMKTSSDKLPKLQKRLEVINFQK